MRLLRLRLKRHEGRPDLPAAYAPSPGRSARWGRRASSTLRHRLPGGGTPSPWGPPLLPSFGRSPPRAGGADLRGQPGPPLARPPGAGPEAGATRVSVGVQSTSAPELAALGRIHGPSARSAPMRRSPAGLRVSCDLMCATPRQSPESWEGSLRDVLSCGVSHVSASPSIEEGTAFWRRGRCPSSTRQTYRRTAWRPPRPLTRSGLRRYEVASYAAPGQECLHNVSYWTGALPGAGHGAAGMLSREGYLALGRVAPQLPAPGDDVARARHRPEHGAADRRGTSSRRFGCPWSSWTSGRRSPRTSCFPRASPRGFPKTSWGSRGGGTRPSGGRSRLPRARRVSPPSRAAGSSPRIADGLWATSFTVNCGDSPRVQSTLERARAYRPVRGAMGRRPNRPPCPHAARMPPRHQTTNLGRPRLWPR